MSPLFSLAVAAFETPSVLSFFSPLESILELSGYNQTTLWRWAFNLVVYERGLKCHVCADLVFIYQKIINAYNFILFGAL